MRLETDRLILRRYDTDSESDVVDSFAIYSHPDVVRFLSGSPVLDIEAHRARLRDRTRFFESLNDGTGFWAMVERETRRIVGTLLLKRPPRSAPEFIAGDEPDRPFVPVNDPAGLSDDHEIGWHLLPARWGRGYATEGARALVRYGFGELNLPDIHAVVDSANARSIAVTKRLGMTHCGLSRDYYNSVTEHFVLPREPQRLLS
jgi:RimJ/RimL family protein N-acetyltransferase